MRNTKILVFGRIGQLGWELRHKLACLGEVTAIDYPEIDFSKSDSIRAVVRAAEPTVILNAAAYTAVDKAENDPDLAMAINGTAPGVIAEEASGWAACWCTTRRTTCSMAPSRASMLKPMRPIPSMFMARRNWREIRPSSQLGVTT